MEGLGQSLVNEASEKTHDKVLTFLLKNGKITEEDAEEVIRYLHEDSSASINDD